MLMLTLAFGMPMGAEWLCILAFLGGVAAVVVLVVRSQRRPQFPPSAFPVIPLGPGRFRVVGVRRDTRKDVVWECDADSPDNARVKAELEGIVVTRIDRA